MSGDIDVVSRGADGVPLRHGAGWLIDHPVQAPVGNDGSAAFIAPMPEYDNSASAQFHASYLATAAGLTMLRQGVDPISVLVGSPLRSTNAQIAGNGGLNRFAILCDERNSGNSATTSAMLHVSAFPAVTESFSLYLGSSPSVLAVNGGVTMDAAGSRLLTYGQNIATRLHVLAGNAIALSTDLTAKIPYNGKRIVLSGDGESIFFAAGLDGYGLLDGQNGIFRYRLSDDSLTFICAAGSTALDPELAVSADGKVVVFRRRTGALAVAELQNGLWICPDDYPIRAASCRHPAISADGRFVAYEASLTAGNTIQVYRYDRWRNRTEPVSVNASAFPADADCLQPALSPDGRQITFVSAATNLATDVTGEHQVYRCELENPTIAEDWILLQLQHGWNLASIPFAPDQPSMARLHKDFFAAMWIWNAENHRFALFDGGLAAGQGFWLYATNNCSIGISKATEPEPILAAGCGWHLLGPADSATTPSLPMSIQDSILVVFNLDTTMKALTRHATASLEYGRAYWAFVPAGDAYPAKVRP